MNQLVNKKQLKEIACAAELQVQGLISHGP